MIFDPALRVALRRALLSFFALTLAACGPGGAGGGSAPQSTGPAPTANQAPVAGADKITVVAGIDTALRVLDNDRDADGDALRIASFTAVAGVEVRLDDAGTPTDTNDDFFVITPSAGFSGTATFAYVVDDGRGGSDQTSVDLDIRQQVVSDPSGNAAPMALPDSAVTAAAAAVAVDALANDSDPDGETLAFVSWTDPAGGTVTLDDGGTPAVTADDALVYTPDAGFSGVDSFVYTVTDGNGTATAAVDIEVGAPVGLADVSGRVPTAGASVALYALDAGGNATGAPFVQTVSDAAGEWRALMGPRTQPLLVVARGGTFIDDAAGLDNVAAARGLPFDSGIELATILPASEGFSTLTVLSNALLLRTRYAAPALGFATALADSRSEMSAAFGFDPLTVELHRPFLPAVSDAQRAHYLMLIGGAANDINAVSLSLRTPAPTAGMVAAQIRDLSDCRLDGRDLDGPIVLTLAGADIAYPALSDLQIESLRYRNNFANAFGGMAPAGVDADACPTPDFTAPVFGSVPLTVSVAALDAGGVAASVDEVTAALVAVVATDNGTAVVVTNDAPTDFPLGVTTVTFEAVDAAGNVAVVSVDFVVSDLTPPTITAPADVTAPTIGLFTPVVLAAPVVSDNVSTGAGIVVTHDAPASGFAVGVTVVTWTATDEAGLSNSATQLVTVTGSGSPTVVAPIGDQVLAQGVAFALDTATAFDDPDGDTLSFALLGLPAGSGLSIDPLSGSLSGTPTQADVAASPYVVTVVASDGALSAGDSLTLLVTDANDPPAVVAPLPDVGVSEDSAVSIATAGAFADADGDTLSFAAVGLPVGLTLNPATGLITGSVDDDAVDGSPYDVTVTASDGAAGVSDVFRIAVSEVNDPPASDNGIGSQTATQGVAFVLDVSAVFADEDEDPLTLAAVGLPASLTLGADQVIRGTPTNAEAMTGTFGVTLSADDGRGGNASVAFVLAVNNVNDAPSVATPVGPQNAVEDAAFALDVSGGFVDIDGDSLTFSAAGLPGSLAIDAAGAISGTPTQTDATGSPYSVTVTATDTGALSVTDTFTLTILDTNDAPTVSAIADPAPVDEDGVVGPLAFTIGDNETAPSSLTVTALSSNPALLAPSGIALGGSGATRDITLTPVADASGSVNVTIEVSDGTESVTELVTIVVNAVNDAPAFTLSADLTLTEDFTGGETVTVTPVAPPADESAQAVSYALSPASVPWANVAIDTNSGTVTVTAVADASGAQTFTVTANDGQPANNTFAATFDLAVTAQNDPPVLVDDSYSGRSDAAQTHDVLANDSDPDMDTLTLTSVISPTAGGGTVAVNDAGTPGNPSDDFVDYLPAPGFVGDDTYTYDVSDGTVSRSAKAQIAVSKNGYVDGIFPADGALAVPVSVAVEVDFSEAMNVATMTSAHLLLSTSPTGVPATAATVSYLDAPQRATITPVTDLAKGTTYYVIVAASIENAGGAPQGFEVVTRFSTDAPDADGDGLTDPEEAALAGAGTCPSMADPDSDNDGLSDGVEVSAGSDPCFDDPGQTIHYVDANGPAGGWPAAVTSLPDPPGSGSAGSPTFVLIASGVYADQVNYSAGCDNVVIVGSLDPADPGQRPELGPDGAPGTVLDMGGSRNSELASCANFTLSTVRLSDGVGAPGAGGSRGGGLRVSGTTTALLEGVWMTDSVVGDQGGGLGISNASVATVRNSVIRDNRVTGGKGGGGIWVGANATLNLEDSSVIDNRADGNGGGGLYFDPNSTGTVTRSVVSGNRASTSYGGGILVLGSGATVAIADSVVTGNRASDVGGGIYVDSEAVQLTNLLITGNYAWGGGGLAMHSGIGSAISNLTVAYNQSLAAGGGIRASGQRPVIVDSIIFANRAGDRTLASAAAGGDSYNAASRVTANYNLVDSDADGAFDIDLTALGRTPDFVGGYYLDQGLSLAVDSGSTTAVAAGLDTYTTQVGDADDTGTVDRGYHYATWWPGAPTSLGIVTPVAGLAAFGASDQALAIELRNASMHLGSGRQVVMRLVNAPAGFAWDGVTSIEPLGPGTVIADDIGNGVYRVKVDLSATASGNLELEVIVDGSSAGNILVPINP